MLAPDAPDAPADEALLRACVAVLAGWGWAHRPMAVAAIPTRRRPELVASVARYLARQGRLDWLGPLAPVGDGPRGQPGGNSAFRLAGVWDAFTVPGPMHARLAELGAGPGLGGGPVLLVDDLVDSRWTMTVAGRALRQAGATAVLPFALATVA